MKKRKMLGTLTIIASLPGLGFMLVLMVIYKFPMTHWIIIEKTIIGFSCILGGVLLWQGQNWGYKLSTIGWMIILYVSLSGIYVAFQPEVKEQARLFMLGKGAIYLTVGLPVLVVLIRDMIKTKSV